MNRTVAILVLDIKVGALIYQRVNYIIIKARDAQMKRTAEDAAALVHICSVFDQAFSRKIIFLTNSETERSALIFVEDVQVNFIH